MKIKPRDVVVTNLTPTSWWLNEQKMYPGDYVQHVSYKDFYLRIVAEYDPYNQLHNDYLKLKVLITSTKVFLTSGPVKYIPESAVKLYLPLVEII